MPSNESGKKSAKKATRRRTASMPAAAPPPPPPPPPATMTASQRAQLAAGEQGEPPAQPQPNGGGQLSGQIANDVASKLASSPPTERGGEVGQTVEVSQGGEEKTDADTTLTGQHGDHGDVQVVDIDPPRLPDQSGGQEGGQKGTEPEEQQGGQSPAQTGNGQGSGDDAGQIADALRDMVAEQDDDEMHGLDLSLTALLANRKDPDEDWDQTGWRNPRHVKALVAFLANFGYRGHKHEQEIVRAALFDYLPKTLLDISRELARGGNLDDLAAEIEKRLRGK